MRFVSRVPARDLPIDNAPSLTSTRKCNHGPADKDARRAACNVQNSAAPATGPSWRWQALPFLCWVPAARLRRLQAMARQRFRCCAGWFEGEEVFYITTDVSHADVAEAKGANFAPRLADALPAGPPVPGRRSSVDKVYAVTNFKQGEHLRIRTLPDGFSESGCGLQPAVADGQGHMGCRHKIPQTLKSGGGRAGSGRPWRGDAGGHQGGSELPHRPSRAQGCPAWRLSGSPGALKPVCRTRCAHRHRWSGVAACTTAYSFIRPVTVGHGFTPGPLTPGGASPMGHGRHPASRHPSNHVPDRRARLKHRAHCQQNSRGRHRPLSWMWRSGAHRGRARREAPGLRQLRPRGQRTDGREDSRLGVPVRRQGSSVRLPARPAVRPSSSGWIRGWSHSGLSTTNCEGASGRAPSSWPSCPHAISRRPGALEK